MKRKSLDLSSIIIPYILKLINNSLYTILSWRLKVSSKRFFMKSLKNEMFIISNLNIKITKIQILSKKEKLES